MDLTRKVKIEYITNNIDNLTKEQRLNFAKIIWSNDKLRNKLNEKGLGIEINSKYISDKVLNILYNFTKKNNYVEDNLK